MTATTNYADAPTVPLTGVPVGTICERRNGNVCRLTDNDKQIASFDSGTDVWSDTGRHDKRAKSPYDIVRIITQRPQLPTGWRIDGEWLVCGDEAAMRRFHDGSVVFADRGCSFCVNRRPDWLPIETEDKNTMSDNVAIVEKLWAAHVAEQSKPVLVWKDLKHISTSEIGDGVYQVRHSGSLEPDHFYAEWYGSDSRAYISSGGVTRDDAKIACERHAKSSK